MRTLIILLISGMFLLDGLAYYTLHRKAAEIKNHYTPVTPYVAPKPRSEITFTVPIGEMSFQDICKQLNKWHEEAPDITELGVVGKTQNNNDIPYLRIGKKTGPKALITAAIHGNEHLGVMVTMGVMGNLLKDYPNNKDLLDSRDIFYVPVVSPESYMKNTRYDMGVDPNRNFSDRNNNNIKSITSIQAMKDFFLKEKFKAAMSCHNFGRIYLFPWGYTTQQTPNHKDYLRILGKMSALSGYEYEKLYRQSAPPYYGYEEDWYYQNGAFSMVNEIGSRFEANREEIAREVKINQKVIELFIQEATLVR